MAGRQDRHKETPEIEDKYFSWTRVEEGKYKSSHHSNKYFYSSINLDNLRPSDDPILSYSRSGRNLVSKASLIEVTTNSCCISISS